MNQETAITLRVEPSFDDHLEVFVEIQAAGGSVRRLLGPGYLLWWMPCVPWRRKKERCNEGEGLPVSLRVRYNSSAPCGGRGLR